MLQGNVNGLRIGAPVKFKGVQIGTVEEIKLALSPSEGEVRPDLKELRLPVIIGIERSMIMQRGGTGHALSQPGLEDLVSRGMRAQLDTESLLTGLLFVDLDLHPNAPLDLALISNLRVALKLCAEGFGQEVGCLVGVRFSGAAARERPGRRTGDSPVDQ